MSVRYATPGSPPQGRRDSRSLRALGGGTTGELGVRMCAILPGGLNITRWLFFWPWTQLNSVYGVVDVRRAPDPHRATVPYRKDMSSVPSTGRDLQARGPKAPACSRPWLRAAALGLSLRLAERAPPRTSRPRRSFASWPGAGSDREEVARGGCDRRFEQPHQRCVLETGRDQQGVTERYAHALERSLDHHRVQTTARRPGQVRRAGLPGGKPVRPVVTIGACVPRGRGAPRLRPLRTGNQRAAGAQSEQRCRESKRIPANPRANEASRNVIRRRVDAAPCP